ncbi:coiled-coil domain-containing protein [Aristophania vespae]|uniref:hypothetical protein n=1 Tax=Aristophania vespae TaxID=2697033 RepID=UPI00235173ED|nr:hypothetical protein [Aristophania vespae]UMM63296.1 Chromosome partition protein Smc [Aristophania vespae]
MSSSYKAHFARLKIVGFKSFADETTLDILPGLTGIVGPNGCGKSNIVEAIRWVMGEVSAKTLRGGESDDLIFAGSASRPARNIARVTLQLEDAKGLAPAPFEESEELAITRQAERGSGSIYRINDRIVRARDVQTLFADLATGARSSAIISQNRVSQLIGAKPEERRAILEEAANVTGLHVRKHDAELKLKQAENNLEQAELHATQLHQRLELLTQQAAQARRYRELSQDIRRFESRLRRLKHMQAQNNVSATSQEITQTQSQLADLEKTLQEKNVAVADLKKEYDEQSLQLNALRPRLEEQKLQLEIAQNNLSHIQKAWDERLKTIIDINADLDRAEKRSATLHEEEKRSQELLTQLEKTLETEFKNLPDLKTQLEQEEQALSQRKAQYDDAKEDYHKANLSYETARNLYENLTLHHKQNLSSLDRIQSELLQIEKSRFELDSLTEAEERVKSTAQSVSEAEKEKQNYADISQNKKIELEKARSALENTLRVQKHLTSEIQLVSKKLEALKVRYDRFLSDKHNIEDSLITPEILTTKKQEVDKAQSLLLETENKEKELRELKDKEEEIWYKARTDHKEKTQKRNIISLEIERLKHAQQTTAQQILQAKKTLDEAKQNVTNFEQIEQLRSELVEKETLYSTASEELQNWRKELKTSFGDLNKTRQKLHNEELQLLRLKGQIQSLRNSLYSRTIDAESSMLETLDFPAELNQALAMALAEGLEANLLAENDTASDITKLKRAWRCLPPFKEAQTPPSDLKPLAEFVKAPPALTRALASIYLLENEQQGAELQQHLLPGQSLVTREGAIWRWDGFIQSAQQHSSEVKKLENLQKLKELEPKKEAVKNSISETELELKNEKDRNDSLQEKIDKKRAFIETLVKQLHNLRFKVQEQEHGKELSHRKIQHALEHIEKSTAHAEEIKNNLTSLQNSLSELDITLKTIVPNQDKVAQAREALSQAHQKHQEAFKSFNAIERHYSQSELVYENSLARLKDIASSITHLEAELESAKQQKEKQQKQLLELDLEGPKQAVAAAQTRLDESIKTLSQLDAHYQNLRQEHLRAQQKFNILTQQQASTSGRRDTLRNQLELQNKICQSLDSEVKEALSRLESLAPLEDQIKKLDALKVKFDEDSRNYQQKRKDFVECERKARSLEEQISTIKFKYQAASAEKEHILAELQTLQQRKHAFELSQDSQVNPKQLTAQVEKHKSLYTALKEQFDSATQKTSSLQTDLNSKQKEFADLQDRRTILRETLSGLTERLKQVQHVLTQLQTHDPLEESQQDDSEDDDLAGKSVTSLRHLLARTQQERENLGGVNLGADDEYNSAKEESDQLHKKLTELTEAISRLRKAISSINKEGRMRINKAFSEMDQHFQTLFSRMFDGGKAHLSFVGSDDPLEAGLEIYAQPPGKKLSTLSLLSGGEQALTALSLIFAAFYCTPAPICVLDEVDAPLDDANVERFCRLIADLQKQANTRFLVVTHHQTTMAHMNQLFGVTMQERGVSRLLSVNLNDGLKFIGS